MSLLIWSFARQFKPGRSALSTGLPVDCQSLEADHPASKHSCRMHPTYLVHLLLRVLHKECRVSGSVPLSVRTQSNLHHTHPNSDRSLGRRLQVYLGSNLQSRRGCCGGSVRQFPFPLSMNVKLRYIIIDSFAPCCCCASFGGVSLTQWILLSPNPRYFRSSLLPQRFCLLESCLFAVALNHDVPLAYTTDPLNAGQVG